MSYLEIEKRHSSKDDDELPLRMSREILHQVDNDLGIEEVVGLAVDELLAKKIGHYTLSHQ